MPSAAAINLVTKNSPYKRTIAATAGTGYNWVSEKAQLNLGFTYGDRFFNDKLRADGICLLSKLTFWFLRHRICMGAG